MENDGLLNESSIYTACNLHFWHEHLQQTEVSCGVHDFRNNLNGISACNLQEDILNSSRARYHAPSVISGVNLNGISACHLQKDIVNSSRIKVFMHVFVSMCEHMLLCLYTMLQIYHRKILLHYFIRVLKFGTAIFVV